MTDVDLPRAGYWRRAAVVLLDGFLVLLPLQVLVALAFALTGGAIQGRFGITSTVCEPYDGVPPALLAQLRPAPPDGPDAIDYCQTRFVGFPTAASLVVSKHSRAVSSSGGVLDSNLFTAYAMNAEREFVDAFDLDIPANLFLALAVIWQWAACGRTLGGRLLGLRVIRTVRDGPPVPGAGRGAIGWGPAFKRLAFWLVVMGVVVLPAGCVALGVVFFIGDSGRLGLLWVAAGVAMIGVLGQAAVWLLVIRDIVKRRDPLYDRWAKTAAVVG